MKPASTSSVHVFQVRILQLKQINNGYGLRVNFIWVCQKDQKERKVDEEYGQLYPETIVFLCLCARLRKLKVRNRWKSNFSQQETVRTSEEITGCNNNHAAFGERYTAHPTSVGHEILGGLQLCEESFAQSWSQQYLWLLLFDCCT